MQMNAPQLSVTCTTVTGRRSRLVLWIVLADPSGAVHSNAREPGTMWPGFWWQSNGTTRPSDVPMMRWCRDDDDDEEEEESDPSPAHSDEIDATLDTRRPSVSYRSYAVRFDIVCCCPCKDVRRVFFAPRRSRYRYYGGGGEIIV